MSNGREIRLSEEWARFGILIVVLIGAVLIIALSRSLIFGHIVPIVLGDGIMSTLPQADLEPPVRVPPEVDEPTETETESAEEEVQTPLDAQTEEAVETEETEDESEAVLVPAESVTHIVKTGETLTSIAEQYDVTVNALVAANGLTAPNRIRIGEQLEIPQP
jgi:LysM repeat protein